jgi:hypothetical protein
MAAAIDSKRRRWDNHPRVARKAKPKVALDDTEAHLVLPEKQYRELLFRDFVRFCRDHDAFVVSVPWQSPAVVQVPLGDGETSRLEIALQQLPKYRVVQLPGTAARLSHGVFETMRQIEVTLWRA